MVTKIENSYAPYTGFGEDYRTSVKFSLMHPENTFPQWISQPRLSTHAIGNSNTVVTQFHGRAPWEMSVRVWLPDLESLERLDDRVGLPSTLRYLYGITKRVGGTREAISSVPYLKLENTILVSIEDEQYEIDGPCEATLTFRRQFAPLPVAEVIPWPDAPSPSPLPLPLLLLPLNSTLAGTDRTGVMTATGAGSIRYEDGPTPNPDGEKINWYKPNPYQGEGSDSIYVTGGAGSGSRVDKAWPYGTKMVKVDPTASRLSWGSNEYLGIMNVKQGDVLTISQYVEAPVGMSLTMALFETHYPSTDVNTQSAVFIGTGQVERIQHTFTIANAQTNQFWWSLGPTNITDDPFYVNGHQAEFGTEATELIPQLVAPASPWTPQSDCEWLGFAGSGYSRRRASLDRALLVEEATTNLVGDPWSISAGAGFDQGWYTNRGAEVTMVRNGNMKPVGYSPAARGVTQTVVNVAGMGGNPVQLLLPETPTISAGQTITGRCFVYHTNPTNILLSVGLSFYTAAWASVTGGNVDERTIPPYTWTEIVKTYTAPAGSVQVIMTLTTWGNSTGTGPVVNGANLTAFGGQLEKKVYATTFCPKIDNSGNIVSGYSWAGTAHASASSRTWSSASTFSEIPESNNATGSAIITFQRRTGRTFNDGTYDVSSFLEILDDGGGFDFDTGLQLLRQTGGIRAFFSDETGTVSIFEQVSSTVVANLGEWHTAYLEWDMTHVGLSVDGESMQSASFSRDGDPIPVVLTLSPSAVQSNALVFDRLLTGEERDRITALVSTGALDWGDFGGIE